MAEKAPPEPKRLNRSVGVGEALGRVLDPVFRKRGFASRDLIAHWAAVAPKPYDSVAQPEARKTASKPIARIRPACRALWN